MIVKDHDVTATRPIVIEGKFPEHTNFGILTNIYSSRNGSRWDSSSARSDSESGELAKNHSP